MSSGRRQRKPEGQPTRGKTARNRLRRVDRFLQGYDPGLLTRRDGAFARAFYVDLGYGEEPVTTLESASRLRELNPELPVLGIEIDPERVARAQPYAGPLTFFRLGGFNLPLGTWPDGTPETVRLVRAFNVLRQYDEEAVAQAYSLLFESILPGGLLVEGTSDPFGSLWVANVVRSRTGSSGTWTDEALVFGTNFRTGFDPAAYQAVLPKRYIHRVVPGEPIHAFFEAWKQAAREKAPIKVWGARQWFVATAQQMATRGYQLDLRARWLRKGVLIWKTSH
ncbi:MAG: methylase [Anaerolineae bacterium]|nr:methylase [Anaerolineae bacterium]